MELLNVSDFLSKDKTQKQTVDEYVKSRGSVFTLFDLIEQDKVYPFSLTNKWLYFNHQRKGILMSEEYSILKMVDEYSFNNLYNRLFNPIVLKVFKYSTDEGDNYTFTAMIHSIDDAAYGVVFNNISYLDIDRIRTQFFDYIEKNDIISINQFIDFGLKLGGKNNNW